VKIRIAITADIPRISEVMRESMAALGARYYDERQTESAVRYIAIVDPQLIDDQTYFVVEDDDEIIACGGWSKRATLFTGTGASDTRSLDPDREPARVRAMFVLPADARRGAGRMILDASEDAARDALRDVARGLPANVVQPDAHVFAVGPDARVGALQFGENLARAIRRTVIDTQQLHLERNRQHPLYYATQGLLFVIDRHYYGNFHLKCGESDS